MSIVTAEQAQRRNVTDPRISVVVPAKNEARNLEVVLPELLAAVDCYEVILVDGGSWDDTVEVARRIVPDVKVVQQVRKGKGNALAAGFSAVTGDIVVMFDADVSADPAEIARFVQALVAGADVAKGSRYAVGGGSDDLTTFRNVGNWGLNLVFNTLFRSRYTDLCYGYNAFWADMIPVLDLPDHRLVGPADGSMVWGDGFEIETVIACRFAASGSTIAEVPSVERLRAYGESNLHAIKDGFRVLRTLVTEWRRARAAAKLAVALDQALEQDLEQDLEQGLKQGREDTVVGDVVDLTELAELAQLGTTAVANPRRTRLAA